jgi:hypothetical protein
MNVTKYGLLIGLLIIMVVVGLFGGHFGYTVHGVPQGGQVYEEPDIGGWLSWVEPILGIVSWVWDGITFMWDMVTFQIDGMPVFISSVFLIMSLLSVFLILSLIRGTD